MNMREESCFSIHWKLLLLVFLIDRQQSVNWKGKIIFVPRCTSFLKRERERVGFKLKNVWLKVDKTPTWIIHAYMLTVCIEWKLYEWKDVEVLRYCWKWLEWIHFVVLVSGYNEVIRVCWLKGVKFQLLGSWRSVQIAELSWIFTKNKV